jgi:uncharacterized protein YdhG (YjbR/CyaY superfamily)
MKKAKSADRSSAAKSKGAAKSVDEYLARVPEPARGTLNKIRAAIRSVVPPGATEAISYGIPAFKYKETLIWFAAFANHCSIFPTAAVIEQFEKELKGFATSKGTIQFPTNKPLPAALLKKLVKARLAQIKTKKKR